MRFTEEQMRAMGFAVIDYEAAVINGFTSASKDGDPIWAHSKYHEIMWQGLPFCSQFVGALIHAGQTRGQSEIQKLLRKLMGL